MGRKYRTGSRAWRRKKRILMLRRAALLLCGVVLIGFLYHGLVWAVSDAEKVAHVKESASDDEQASPTDSETLTLTVDDMVQEMGGFIDAKYAVLVDVTEGRIIAQKKPDTQAYPASIAKIMTLLVAVEHIPDLEDTFEVTYAITDPGYLQGASMAGFKNKEQVKMWDLLYGCILPSGADATAALAHVVAGSEEAFADLMNQKAKELGLENTHFANASGLHHADFHTTPKDMAVILMAAMKNETCRMVLCEDEYVTAKTPQNPDGLQLYSTLFSRMYGDEPEGATIIGGKTGYTYEAKHTMASYAEGEDGHDYVIVTMGGSNNYKATYDHINILSKYVGGATDGFYPKE